MDNDQKKTPPQPTNGERVDTNPDEKKEFDVEEKILANMENPTEQQYEDEVEDKRLVKPNTFSPTNSIDTAHLLMSSSVLTSYMPELDKEIKLANLNNEEKSVIWQFQSVWEDLLWLREHQRKRIDEFENVYGSGSFRDLNYEDYMLEQIANQNLDGDTPEIFDALAALRKSQRAAVLSRGTRGFERIQQVSTISTNVNEQKDTSETKPGFMSKISGGFK